ncbi:flagellar protein FlaG [Paramaledivibacter caminithermalis]|jgi:flagellar protein FlaG|uniref:Flagellar protein FlaG n=1 Tax=Paramaledivibacter caminithermalis (strain DSM 15212 / CIP 107654 / DViRD3) TaxID=1121301 RepID=A0A1M6L7B8_PARC5|nr:flagellar protein FlaG [Paramaledivibacter caminithermalis]SHJ67101.1 flagellar protein FlaG [Paramaledivibacter caminithermalis DSM 15212]
MRIEGITSVFANQSINSIIDMNNVDAVDSARQLRSSENNGSSRREEDIPLSEKTIKEAVDKANKKLVLADRKFELSINDETNDIIVKVINKETDEVVREIPSEKILDMVAKMMELAGLFVDERR